MFDHEGFSRTMKVKLHDYLEGKPVGSEGVDEFIQALSPFNAKSLSGDAEKKAFWINLYNGLTNYFIITNKLESL